MSARTLNKTVTRVSGHRDTPLTGRGGPVERRRRLQTTVYLRSGKLPDPIGVLLPSKEQVMET